MSSRVRLEVRRCAGRVKDGAVRALSARGRSSSRGSAVADDGAEGEDGFGAGDGPPAAGDVESVGDHYLNQREAHSVAARRSGRVQGGDGAGAVGSGAEPTDIQQLLGVRRAKTIFSHRTELMELDASVWQPLSASIAGRGLMTADPSRSLTCCRRTGSIPQVRADERPRLTPWRARRREP